MRLYREEEEEEKLVQAGGKKCPRIGTVGEKCKAKGKKNGNKGQGTQGIFNQDKTMEKAAKYSGINGKSRKYYEAPQLPRLVKCYKMLKIAFSSSRAVLHG